MSTPQTPPTLDERLASMDARLARLEASTLPAVAGRLGRELVAYLVTGFALAVVFLLLAHTMGYAEESCTDEHKFAMLDFVRQARHGDREAQFRYGLALVAGDCMMGHNPDFGRYLLEEALRQGHPGAAFAFGIGYETGEMMHGGKPFFPVAWAYFRLAAELAPAGSGTRKTSLERMALCATHLTATEQRDAWRLYEGTVYEARLGDILQGKATSSR